MKILDHTGREMSAEDMADVMSGDCDDCGGCNTGRKKWKSAYAAAGDGGIEGWYRKNRPEDKEFLKHRKKIVGGALEAYRNDSYTQGAVNEKVALTITDKWRVRITPDMSVFSFMDDFDKKDLSEYARDWSRKFMIDMKSRRKWIDASGKNDFLGLLRLDLLSVIVRGESFIKINDIDNPRGPMAFNVQVLDPERVGTPSRMMDDETIVDGIRKSSLGYQSEYFVHKYHASVASDNPFVRVPALNILGQTQMLHNMTQWTPDLTRGLSQLASNLIDIKKRGIIKDAALDKLIVNAQIALVITSNKHDVANAFDMTAEEAEMFKYDVKKYMDDCWDHHNDMGGIKFGANNIMRLFDGEKLDGWANDSSGDFKDLYEYLRGDQARPLGLSKEVATQDWGSTNFSGARSGMISIKRHVGTERQRTTENTSQTVLERWLADAFRRGKIQMPGIESPLQAWRFFMDNVDAISCSRWIGGAWEEIDPVKTAASYNLYKDIGIGTEDDACTNLLGEIFEDVLDQKFYELECYNRKLELAGYSRIQNAMEFLRPGSSLTANLVSQEIQREND